MTDFYERYPEYYDFMYGGETLQALDFVRYLLDHYGTGVDDDRILDMGAGTGGLLIPLTIDGYNITGVEPFEGMISLAQEKAAEEGVKINLSKGRFETLNEQSSYKLILAINGSMHYLYDPEVLYDAFKRLDRALVVEGRVVIDLINFFGVIKYYEHPIPKESLYDGVKVLTNVHHHVNLVEGTWTNHTVVFIEQEQGWERVDDYHEMSMLTLRELRLYAQPTSLELEELYTSYSHREPGDESGARLIAVFKKH